MERANETLAGIMTTENMIRDGVVGCELIDAEKPCEHVLVTYKGSYTKRIGTYMDSYAAIIRDVARRFQ